MHTDVLSVALDCWRKVIETHYGKSPILDGRRIRRVEGGGDRWVVAEIRKKTGLELCFGHADVSESALYLTVISILALIVWLSALLVLAPT